MALDRVRVNERSTKIIEFDILDENGDGVPAASLTDAELTLVDLDTFVPASPDTGVINSRLDQDVLNANNVTISSAGHVTWTMQAADNVVINTRRQVERHLAKFYFAWSGGQFRYEFEIDVLNLRIGS